MGEHAVFYLCLHVLVAARFRHLALALVPEAFHETYPPHTSLIWLLIHTTFPPRSTLCLALRRSIVLPHCPLLPLVATEPIAPVPPIASLFDRVASRTWLSRAYH